MQYIVSRRRLKLNHQIKSSPERWINQFGMVGGGQQQARARPIVNFLQDDGYQSLEFANIRIVTSPFSDCVDFIQEEDARLAFCVIQRHTQICTATAKKATHNCS